MLLWESGGGAGRGRTAAIRISLCLRFLPPPMRLRPEVIQFMAAATPRK